MNEFPEKYKIKASDTNLEALKSKKSAVDYGYLKDDFIHYFVEEKYKREVIIRIGYFNRCYCFQKLFAQFLLSGNMQSLKVLLSPDYLF